jgi:putative heme-binding domain-containing protein
MPRRARRRGRLGRCFAILMLFAQHWRTVELETQGPAVLAALQVLQQDASTDRLGLLLQLLERPELVRATLPLLRRYEAPEVAAQLLVHLPTWDAANVAAAMELLTSRSTWASALLDAVTEGRVAASVVTAYHVRQMVGLGDAGLTQRLETSWGKAGQTSTERAALIDRLVQRYEAAPLWAYDSSAGKQHFEKLCASCHQASAAGANLGPLLAGSGAKGIAYLVENIVDPDAVVGRDFQARLILTKEGRVITGLMIDETPSAITIRTANDAETIAKEEIEEIRISEQSFMPAGLLEPLEERETIELFKYLLEL